MGRFVLFLLASVALGGVVIGVSSSDRNHASTQSRAIARETLDDGVATILDAAIDPARRAWKTSSPIGETFSVGGREVSVEDYHLEERGQVAVFTLSTSVGRDAVRQTSRYILPDPGWPGPLWVDAPYAVSNVDPNARIDGTASGGTRNPVFDATRFNAFRLTSVLNLSHLGTDLGAPLESARGSLGPLAVHTGMGSILAQYDAPRVIDVVGRALNELAPGDAVLSGNTLVSDARTYGDVDNSADTRIVRVKGDLTITPTGSVEGGGLLLVEGNLIVQGTLKWGGLVVVRSQKQHVGVDLETGTVEIRGSVVVDQEAPPPGGHTDLTVNRSVNGVWTTPYGESSGSGTWWRPWYAHSHRIDFTIPEKRTFYFAERGRDRHESYTKFRQTLNEIASASPGEEVYVRFRNPRNHGSAVFHLAAGGEVYDGSVAVGFGNKARQGDAWASPSFLPVALDTFIVDVQSLRMLQHLVNGEVPKSPFWNGGTCWDRPQCVGQTQDRDGALATQIVRASDDQVLYEASIYWHTKEAGHAEFIQEENADAAWRQAIRDGSANYGASIKAGPGVDVGFDNSQVARVLKRLRFNTLELGHISSYVQEYEVTTTTTGPTPPTNPGPPSEPPGAERRTLCHRGSTIHVNRIYAAFHRFHGDAYGACGQDDSGRQERD